MKIQAKQIDGEAVLVLSDVFSGIGIETDAGLFGIAQRDGGIEVLLNGKIVWSLHMAEIADRRTQQVEEIARLVSRPHCSFTPDEVVGAVKGLLSNLRHPD